MISSSSIIIFGGGCPDNHRQILGYDLVVSLKIAMGDHIARNDGAVTHRRKRRVIPEPIAKTSEAGQSRRHRQKWRGRRVKNSDDKSDYMVRNEPTKSIDDPENQLIFAVFIRARLDLLFGSKKKQRKAELFFWQEGIDPDEVRRAWADVTKPGRPGRSENGEQAAA